MRRGAVFLKFSSSFGRLWKMIISWNNQFIRNFELTFKTLKPLDSETISESLNRNKKI